VTADVVALSTTETAPPIFALLTHSLRKPPLSNSLAISPDKAQEVCSPSRDELLGAIKISLLRNTEGERERKSESSPQFLLWFYLLWFYNAITILYSNGFNKDRKLNC
jgi:hypothetical protein